MLPLLKRERGTDEEADQTDSDPELSRSKLPKRVLCVCWKESVKLKLNSNSKFKKFKKFKKSCQTKNYPSAVRQVKLHQTFCSEHETKNTMHKKHSVLKHDVRHLTDCFTYPWWLTNKRKRKLHERNK